MTNDMFFDTDCLSFYGLMIPISLKFYMVET